MNNALITQNPGSALGEAIGASMESALSRYLEPLVRAYDCRMLNKGPLNPTTKRYTKLLMYDNFGTQYSIDGVIVNEANQPLVLLESKYIRYKKHNRDKGSWICHAHGEIRNRYSSVRSSIAILAGNWSKTSLKMITSHGVNVFLVPFHRIVEILAKRDIDFNWGEKDRNLAVVAWERYLLLPDKVKAEIGDEMIEGIKIALSDLLSSTLSQDIERKIDRVIVEIYSNLGEVKRFEFLSRELALNFLDDFTLEDILDHSDSFTIFDIPTVDE